jgi:ABC-type bacteriocin/lantibiotic exporter with double-glycine peptidase domain
MLEEKDYQNRKINPQTWKRLLGYAKPYRKKYAILLTGSMAAGIIDLIMSFMSMWAIDGFMYRKTTEHRAICGGRIRLPRF